MEKNIVEKLTIKSKCQKKKKIMVKKSKCKNNEIGN